MSELAQAYVQIIPSAKGIKGSISSVLGNEAERSGKEAGGSFAGNFSGVVKKAIAALGVGAVVKEAISATSGFESAMAKASTLFSGTSEDFDTLQSTILSLSSATGMSAEQLAEAAYSAESASVPMEDLASMLEGSAKLAVAGFTDVDTALSATAKTMNAYGMEGEEAIEKVQKVLIQTQNKGITTVGELGASLAQVTPTAASFGVSFEQVGAALAGMTAQGTPTAQATTQLNSLIAELGKSGTTASKNFAELTSDIKEGGLSFSEAMAMGWDLSDILEVMQKGADDSGKSMVDMFSSIEAGKAALSIFNSDWESTLSAMSEESDVVAEGYSEMASTLENKTAVMQQSFSNLLIAMGSGGDVRAAFSGLTNAVFSWAGGILPIVGQLFSGLPDVLNGAIDMAVQGLNLAKLHAGDIMNSGANLVVNLAKGLLTGVPYLLESAAGLAGALMDSLLSTDWGGLLNGFFKAIKKELPQILKTGSSMVTKLAGGMLKKLPELISGAYTLVSEFIGGIGDLLPDIVTSGADLVVNLAKGAVDSIPLMGQAALKGIGNVITTISDHWPDLKRAGANALKTLWTGFSGLFPQFLSSMSDLISEALQGISGFLNEHIPGLSSVFDALTGTIGSAFEGLILFWNNILSPAITAVAGWFGGLIAAGAEDGLSGVAGYITGTFSDAWGNFAAWFSETGIGQAISNVSGWFGGLVSAGAEGGLSGVAEYLTGSFMSAWNQITDLFSENSLLASGITHAKSWFSGLKGSAEEGGLAGVASYVTDTFTNAFNNLASGVFGEGSNLENAINTAYGWFSGLITEGQEGGISGLVSYISGTFVNAWDAFKTLFDGGGDQASGVGGAIDSLKIKFTNMKDRYIKPVADYISGSFTEKWNSLEDTLTNVGVWIKDTFSVDWQEAWDTISGIFGAVWEGFKAIAASPINAIIDMMNSLIGNIKTSLNTVIGWINDKMNISVPGLELFGEVLWEPFNVTLASIPAINWPDNPIPHIGVPAMASGGYLSRGAAIIAEAGPELLSLEDNRAVVQPLNRNAKNYRIWQPDSQTRDTDKELNRLLSEVGEALEDLPEAIARLKVVMNTGQLVGAMVRPMDEALGQRQTYQQRRI